MSNAWETTTEDVETVLKAHGIKLSKEKIEEIHGDLDHDAIEDGLLNYCSMDVQTQSMFDDIENHLIVTGVVTGDKKFNMGFVDETENDSEDAPW